MSPMLFIFVWYTLPIFAYVGVRCCTERAIRMPAILWTMVCGYLLIIATVVAADVTDRSTMRKFDPNRNGRIDAFERTSEADRAIMDQGNDTGRALAPMLGIPLTAIWYTVLYGLLFGCDWIFRKLFVRTHIPPNLIVEPEHGSG
jgi:hypothetical protein